MGLIVRICFLLSGASGLIFELLWTRQLTLVFGSTTLAVSTVLTAFMGGLGLGSFIAGRVADRLRDPIGTYARLEAGIGVYALLIPLVIARYPALNQALWAAFGDHYGLLSLLRFAAAAALLLLPTTLMGATLPVLSRYFVAHPWELPRVGARLGTLYAINLFGAVAGSFLAGFVFLPSIGVRATNWVAASFNLTLAAAALGLRWVLARRQAPATASLDELLAKAQASAPTGPEAVAEKPAVPLLDARTRRVVLAAFIVSGATAMTLQGLWTRTLAVVIGSSIFSFTLILLAFLVGLGSGSAVFGRIADKTAHPVRWLCGVHLGIAVCVGLSYLLVDHLPFMFAWLVSSTGFSVDAVLVCQFALACLTVLPSTFLMGAVFPLTIRIVTADLNQVGRQVGFAYALNTIGAIVGSFLSGFVVLPLLGLQKGIYVAVVCGLAVAGALALVAPAPRRWRLAVAGLAPVLAVAGLLLPRWNLTNFSQGFFRMSIAREYIEKARDRRPWQTPKLEFYEDGVATTVTVDRWNKTFSLKNNGKVDASSDADMPTQVSVGLLPMLLQRGVPEAPPARVALVGFGSGVTAGSVTQAPIASLEVVELEPAIYRASHYFDFVNQRPLENTLVTARVGDGRNFLSQRSDRFDVIISEPSNPWITGVSNLFTREYFQDIKRRLAPGGLFCQWAQLYEMAPWNVKTIYRTLRTEFPYVYVFAAEDLSSDTILIATLEPLPLDVGRIGRVMRDPKVAAEARRAGWESPFDVVAQVLLAPDEIESFTAGAVVNTDDNARIEFAAPRDLLGYARYDPYLAKVYGPQWPYGRLLDVVTGFDAAHPAGDMARLSRSLLAHGRHREAESWARRAEALGGAPDPAVAHARLLLNLVATRMDRDPEVPLTASEDDGLEPPRVPAGASAELAERLSRDYASIDALVRDRRYVTAYKTMETWPASMWDKPPPDFALLAGFLHYKAEYYGDAIELLRPLATDDAFLRRRPAVLYYLGRAQFANADYDKAIKTLERYVALRTALGAAVSGPLLPPATAPPRERAKPL